MTQHSGRFRFVGVMLIAFAGPSWAGPVGSAAPPTPAIELLKLVEPRTPIRAADLPLTITTPGAYYLAEDAAVSGAGITVASSDVSIDLMGFLLDAKIDATGTLSRITVKNGTVAGLEFHTVSAVRLADVSVRAGGGGTFLGDLANVQRLVMDNTIPGLFCGDSCVVSDSQIRLRRSDAVVAGSHAILTNVVASGADSVVGSGAIVTHCSFYGYDFALHGGDSVEVVESDFVSGGGSFALSVGAASRIFHSHVWGGIDYSVRAGDGSVIDGLVATDAQGGIWLGDGSQIANSVIATGNKTAITVGSHSSVIANSCRANRGDPASNGILVTGSGNRVEGNVLVDSGVGLTVTGSGNVVIRNNAHNNSTANYQIAAGNDVGPIGTAASSTSPWANIEY